MKHSTALFIHFMFSVFLSAQPTIQWQKCAGGSGGDVAACIEQTNDGGFVVVGFSASTNGDVSGWHGGIDFWVVKLSSTGEIQWQKMLGGTKAESAHSIQQTSDGGYVVAGYTNSDNGDVSGNHGESDYWVMKLTGVGTIEWQRVLGGSNEDVARSIQQTSDGGYIIAGWSFSNDGDVSGNNGLHFWVVKLDNLGVVQWQDSFGGSNGEYAYSVRQTSDGGYVIAGETWSNDGDVSGNHGNTDIWVVKLNNTGSLEWQKALGGKGIDTASSIQETIDGGYIVAGTTGSYNSGQVSGNHGGFDIWIVKLNQTGDFQWQKALGGSSQDYGNSIQQTSDGGYIVVGTTLSADGDVLGNDGGQDYWIVKLNDLGAIQWQKTLGGTDTEIGTSIQQTNDGGYVLAGNTESNDYDVSGNHGSKDYWVVKLSPESVGVEDIAGAVGSVEIYPNPANQSVSLQAASEEPTLNVSVTDLLGREISQQSIQNGGRVDVSLFAKGLYLLTATTPSGRMFSGKLRKE